MLARLHTFSLVGIDAVPVEVEVDVAPVGAPKVVLVGLPEAAVRESRHRVDRAIVNSGFQRPKHRTVINLAPAELPKQAASFDLPITLGMLAASGQFASDRLDAYAVVGELALEGQTRHVRGTLSMAMTAARRRDCRGVVVPVASAAEAAVVEGAEVIPVACLAEAVAFFAGQLDIDPYPSQLERLFQQFAEYEEDFADVRGQETAKRALTVAAAGGHNLLMVGPPGSGKTMLARRLPSILPGLEAGESLETTRIYSVLGLLPPEQALLARRPFRSPHHTISDAGLVGGGSMPSPGEISLAHHGVLFLDELPEFQRRTLEVMRQPLEEGRVTIARALRSTTFPADFMLVAAMNPCPCGYRHDPRRTCGCSSQQTERYLARLSGPLLDRIDIHIEVPAITYRELSSERAGTSSAEMRERVTAARHRQAQRFAAVRIRRNAQMSSPQVRRWCRLDAAGRELLRTGIQEMGLSARAHDKILRLARTIADLEDCDQPRAEHVAEAVQYRLLDRDQPR